jgi:nucleoside-diphosphate-sugar epimerase
LRVLVTGAGGFIGRNVVAALTARGHEVRALVRSDVELEAEVVRADLRFDDLRPALDGMDAVVHLAAQMAGDDDERFSGTVVATERLLGAMEGSGVRRMVLASSYSVYDWSRAQGRLDEDAPLAEPPYERDGYTVAKVWQERIVRRAARTQGFQLVVLRPGFVWGPGALDASLAGIPAGPLLVVPGPLMRVPLTYVENCAACFAAAVDVAEADGATFNVVDSAGVRAWPWARAVVRCTDEGRVRVPVPYVVAHALVRAIAAVSRTLFRRYGGKLPTVLVPVRFEARFKPLRHSSSRVREVLGWQPAVDFDEALRRTCAADGGARDER